MGLVQDVNGNSDIHHAQVQEDTVINVKCWCPCVLCWKKAQYWELNFVADSWWVTHCSRFCSRNKHAILKLITVWFLMFKRFYMNNVSTNITYLDSTGAQYSCASQSVFRCMDGRTNGWMDGWTGRTGGRTDGRMNGWMNECTWMNKIT